MEECEERTGLRALVLKWLVICTNYHKRVGMGRGAEPPKGAATCAAQCNKVQYFAILQNAVVV